MKRVLLVDNYDSFTYNLVHLLGQFDNVEISVFRNDAISIEAVSLFDAIILSPGPGLPEDAGIVMELIKCYYNKKPIFGVCLGMQALGLFFGAKLINMPYVQHGVKTKIQVKTESFLFNNMASEIEVGRYHSWAFEKDTLPSILRQTADDGVYVMALEHAEYPISGVQFHPESILTDEGKQIIGNWLSSF